MLVSTLPQLQATLLSTVLMAGLVAMALVITKKWHGRYSMDGLIGVQKTHAVPTPRIGGVAIISGLIVAWASAPPPAAQLLCALLLAGLPAMLFGLAEDITKKVSVTSRLLATMGSGVLLYWIAGLSITRVDVPMLDPLFQWPLFSLIFTAVAVGGIANAVNIVDGFNGLASGFVFIAQFALAVLAFAVGDATLGLVSFALAAAVGGFWLINWPWGKLFLGDGGSYFGGFALASTSVFLLERNASINAFVPLLICIHPVTEVLFSIYRRQVRHDSPGDADRLHLHSLIMRRAVQPWLRRVCGQDTEMADRLRNPLTGLVVATLSLAPAIVACQIEQSSTAAGLACAVFVLIYMVLYARLVRFSWCLPHHLFKRRSALTVRRDGAARGPVMAFDLSLHDVAVANEAHFEPTLEPSPGVAGRLKPHPHHSRHAVQSRQPVTWLKEPALTEEPMTLVDVHQATTHKHLTRGHRFSPIVMPRQ